MSKPFDIQNDKVIITTLNLKNLEGAITHAGSLEVLGNANLRSNVNVVGTLTVGTLKVDNLLSNNGPQQTITNWNANNEQDLNGKGFSWTWKSDSANLMYRAGKHLWTNCDLDLAAGQTYKISDIDVIGYDFLGTQVSKSNLTQVGTLESLEVSGDATFGQFAFFNEATSRLGLNTDQPNGVLSVSENNVEFIIGAPNYGAATIGTYTNSDVLFVSDNTPRFTLKNTGEVIFGNAITNSAVVTINGTLNVTTLLSDTRLDRFSPLEFKPNGGSSIYGLGLVWTGTSTPTRLVMMPDPDRLFSTESIDIDANQSYYVNGKAVLSETELGASIVSSNLSKLGTLSSLLVSGDATFGGKVNAQFGITLPLSNDNSSTTIVGNNLNTSKSFSISVGLDTTFYTDSGNVSLGNKLNTNRTINLYGQVGIGLSSIDSSVGLDVASNIRFAGKKFVTGNSAPLQGSFVKGDICWNQNPIPGSYIGWVCIANGGPGQWAPFGSISQQ